jgi:hypothetical protein
MKNELGVRQYSMSEKLGKTIAIFLMRLGGEVTFTKEEVLKFSIEELDRRGADMLSLPQDDGSVRLSITFERD